MAGFALHKNKVFNWSGAEYRIDRIQANGDVLLERMNDGQLSVVSREQLLTEYAEGKISAKKVDATFANSLVPSFSRPLDELSEAVRNAVKRRKHYLESILDHGVPVFTPEYLKPLIERAATEIGDAKPPAVITLYRWYRRFKSMNDARAIIPRTDLCGPRETRQSDLILQLVAESLEEAFKASPQATCRNIYTRLLGKIDIENQRKIGGEPIKPPSLRTVYRLVERAEAYELAVLKGGKAAADRRFRIGKAGVKTSRILERVEIDHTPLDLFLIDEKSWLPLGRPTLTVIIDHYSRMLLGYYLSFDSPSTAAVMGALRHAILPKKLADQVIPNLKNANTWPCYGLLEVMVVDNGLEFHGNDLESVAYDLGIRIQYCPKHTPRFKGVVERYLKTVNYFFAHQLPGTSFAKFYQRGDYDPQKAALLTFAEFKQIFEKWVVDVYAQDEHRGLGKTTPWARWQEGFAHYEPVLPDDLLTLQRRIGLVEERSLRRDGIVLHGIRYSGDELSPILRGFGEGVKVRLVYDPEDLGEIQVWGPNDAEPVTVKALDYDFAHGLTVKQNEFIREQLREQGAAVVDRVALERARYELSLAIEELMTSRKHTARRRSAALRGINSSKPNGSETPIGNKPDSTKNPKRDIPVASSKFQQNQDDKGLEIIKSFQMKRQEGIQHEL
ncbi:Mu transposase C-terminal domain-containing protein [Methylomonas rapida]|uniref:Mu transposase C-terminal domain-containing protein n=1 Tax=Methylomonas rapida TaxID=2963939 RepID=A0ABY7GJS1_9GAMM|nr:Mu transposase C-terminal domain-containing protein [Methylomonas rapida]WAR44939.1 Mu transposase C-terminal domain-containing protein [Methylomonas rapida]